MVSTNLVNKGVVVPVSMKMKLKEEIDIFTGLLEISRSDFMRRAVKHYIKSIKNKKIVGE